MIDDNEDPLRIADPRKFMWGDGDLTWTDDEKPTTQATIKSAIGELANDLAIHGATRAHRVMVKAYQAVDHGEFEAAAGMVDLAKGLLSGQQIADVLNNLFSSIGSMLGETIQQLRSVANPIAGSSALVPSLGLRSGANQANWPTL